MLTLMIGLCGMFNSLCKQFVSNDSILAKYRGPFYFF